MEEKEINPAESLQIIQSMINTAKNKLADDSFLLMFWGWLIFAAAIIHYITLLLNIEYGDWVWPVFIPVGMLVSVIYSVRQHKKEKVKTYIDTYMGYLWTAFGVALIITLFSMQVNGVRSTYFFLMLLYGLATFVSGGLLNFRPLVIGGGFSFAVAIVAPFVQEKELLPCLAASLLFSYIIPGHLLHAKFKSQNV